MMYLIFIPNLDIVTINGIYTNNLTFPTIVAVTGYEIVFYFTIAHTLRASNIYCNNTQGQVFSLIDVFDHSFKNVTLTNMSTNRAVTNANLQNIIQVQITKTLASYNLNTSKPIASTFDNINIKV